MVEGSLIAHGGVRCSGTGIVSSCCSLAIESSRLEVCSRREGLSESWSSLD